MSLNECMRSHTHRQYRAWLYWLCNTNLNRPSRSDYYLMQISKEVRAVLTKEFLPLKDFKLSSENESEKETPEEQMKKAMQQKMILLAWAGVKNG